MMLEIGNDREIRGGQRQPLARLIHALALSVVCAAPLCAQTAEVRDASLPPADPASSAPDAKQAASALAARLGASGINPDERTGIIGELETLHSAALQKFESETRSELTRIARDKALSGEEKIIRIEDWFSIHTDRIAEINRMADTLDQNKPLAKPALPARPVDPSPEGTAATSLHDLSRSLANGKITVEEFDRSRKPHLDLLNALREQRKAVSARLPAPPVAENPDVSSDPEKIADDLHALNRYLASLPENEAAQIRADPDSSINRLLLALGSREQPDSADETHSEPPNLHTNPQNNR